MILLGHDKRLYTKLLNEEDVEKQERTQNLI